MGATITLTGMPFSVRTRTVSNLRFEVAVRGAFDVRDDLSAGGEAIRQSFSGKRGESGVEAAVVDVSDKGDCAPRFPLLPGDDWIAGAVDADGSVARLQIVSADLHIGGRLEVAACGQSARENRIRARPNDNHVVVGGEGHVGVALGAFRGGVDSDRRLRRDLRIAEVLGRRRRRQRQEKEDEKDFA